jgi:hypothetical protein
MRPTSELTICMRIPSTYSIYIYYVPHILHAVCVYHAFPFSLISARWSCSPLLSQCKCFFLIAGDSWHCPNTGLFFFTLQSCRAFLHHNAWCNTELYTSALEICTMYSVFACKQFITNKIHSMQFQLANTSNLDILDTAFYAWCKKSTSNSWLPWQPW